MSSKNITQPPKVLVLNDLVLNDYDQAYANLRKGRFLKFQLPLCFPDFQARTMTVPLRNDSDSVDSTNSAQ